MSYLVPSITAGILRVWLVFPFDICICNCNHMVALWFIKSRVVGVPQLSTNYCSRKIILFYPCLSPRRFESFISLRLISDLLRLVPRKRITLVILNRQPLSTFASGKFVSSSGKPGRVERQDSCLLSGMMTGRWLSKPGWISSAILTISGCLAQNLPVPPLPYSYSALVPFISEHALRVSN